MTREDFEKYENDAEFDTLEDLTFLRAFIRERMELNFASKLELRSLSTGLFLIQYIEKAYNWSEELNNTEGKEIDDEVKTEQDNATKKLIADEIIFLLNSEEAWAELSLVLAEAFLVENDTAFENNTTLFGWYYNNQSKKDRIEEVLNWSLVEADEQIIKTSSE